MSKSITPFLIWSAKSSKPTRSAPAFLASSAASPWAKTATLVDLPVPLGRTNAPLTS